MYCFGIPRAYSVNFKPETHWRFVKHSFSANQSIQTIQTRLLSFIAEQIVPISNNFDIELGVITTMVFIKCNRLAQHDHSEIIASVFLALVSLSTLSICAPSGVYQSCLISMFYPRHLNFS